MTTDPKKRRGLGRGLESLIGDIDAGDPLLRSEPGARGQEPTQSIPIELFRANRDQPRRQFAEDKLKELAGSIREKGIIQPLIARPDPENKGEFQIVAGERRWRAAQLAKLHRIPAIIRNLSDEESFEIALIENIQRADLNPMEEARAYRQLMDRFGYTQDRLSGSLGKSRSHIANLLRLLSLPAEVCTHIENSAITAGHARQLVGASNPTNIARQIISKGLSVRQTEELAKGVPDRGKNAKRFRIPKSADTKILEATLSANLNASVSIEPGRTGNSGKLIIKYRNLDQLENITGILIKSGMNNRSRR